MHGLSVAVGGPAERSGIDIDVQGSGSDLPADSDLVALPGAYALSEQGLALNIYVRWEANSLALTRFSIRRRPPVRRPSLSLC